MDVLILDHDAHQVDTIRRGLLLMGHAGHPVDVAAARARLAAGGVRGTVDAVVCDLTDGDPATAAFVRALRADRPTVALVVIAGLRTPPAVAALEAEGVVTLRRPFGPADLAAALATATR